MIIQKRLGASCDPLNSEHCNVSQTDSASCFGFCLTKTLESFDSCQDKRQQWVSHPRRSEQRYREVPTLTCHVYVCYKQLHLLTEDEK